jgi:hypothetical protein
MDKVQTVKLITKFIVGIGVTKIVSSIVDNNVQPRGSIDKVFIQGGSLAAGFMAADAVGHYTDEKIDELFSWSKAVDTKSPSTY